MEKQKDISIMKSMGFENSMIRNVFLFNGILISIFGIALGLSAAFLLLWLQENYGLVGMGMETAIVDAYPVKLLASDFVLTAVTMLIVSLIISIYPAQKAMKVVIGDNV